MALPESVRVAIAEAPIAFLATHDQQGPNVVAVGFFWVEGDAVVVADVFFQKTRSNLAGRAQAALAVGGTSPAKWGYQIKGPASLRRAGAEQPLSFSQAREVENPRSVGRGRPGI